MDFILVPIGPGLDWAGWFTLLAARAVQGLTTDDDPVYEPALEAAGLDRQQCAVHMQRSLGRHIRGLDGDDLTHLDRVLLPMVRRVAWARPPEAGPDLLALREAVMQGRVRLHREVRKLLWHLVERWHELVRSQGNPMPASTNRLVWSLQAPGPSDTGAEERNRRPQLRVPDGPQHGLKRRAAPAGTENTP